MKVKARRRARKLQEKAWEAAADGNLDMASKLLQQALEECQENPEIWNDYGLILQQLEDYQEAEKALRNAILIAPAYAEAYANLAALVAQLGRTIQAERLQSQAVEHEPQSRTYREQLEMYRALRPQDPPPASEPAGSESAEEAEDPEAELADRELCLGRYDWSAIGEELLEHGCAKLGELLTAEDCDRLIGLYADDGRFEKTVELAGEDGAAGAYRFFRRPLPSRVGQLRTAVYGRLAPIVNRWEELLGRPPRWPLSHRGFLARCAEAGQTRTTPILLRYQAPAVNELHQDVWGKVYFPLQLAVTLSPRAKPGAAGFEGGSFVLADEGSGRKCRRLEVPLSQGDAVVFCTRERLLRVGRSYALQSVLHGMAPLTAGERYVVGIPFHDYSSGAGSK